MPVLLLTVAGIREGSDMSCNYSVYRLMDVVQHHELLLLRVNWHLDW